MKNKHLLCLLSVLIFFASSLNEIVAADKAVAAGSFVQSWLCGRWSDARWQQEFAAMKKSGMEYLIIGPVAESEENKTTITWYPSSLPNTELYGGLYGTDMVDVCLRNAEAAGIKVFIGLAINPLWWGPHGEDTTWFYNQMRFDNQVCHELWGKYKTKYPNAFYGWYWVYEIDNVSFADSIEQEELITAMNIQLDYLNNSGEKLPLMWCPFMNADLGTSEDYKNLWINVFSKIHTTAGDIFAPQDCIGAGGLGLSRVEEWFAALRQAVDTKPGLEFWSDVETFTTNGMAGTMDRFVTQLKKEQPYVDNYVTFAYSHYYSPCNVDSGFDATYRDYVKNGVLESVPPSAPANFKAVSTESGCAELSWDASTDNIGICGYIVYRNGVQISKTQVSRLDGAASVPPLALGLADGSLKPNTTYTYTARAYDFANNLSEASAEAVITTGTDYILPNKISAACSYTVSISADAKYPDKDNKELTNGSYARIMSKGDPAWEGVYDLNKRTREIIFDLGSITAVRQFTADFLNDSANSVSLPKKIQVLSSTDGSEYTDHECFTLPNVPLGASASAFKCIKTLSSSAKARYIKYLVSPGNYWTFADEFEVRNDTSSIGVDEGEEALMPASYSLKQNYPNPFNPSTIICYDLPSQSEVALKVYNVLGKEVRTLVNKTQSAGSYRVSFDASDIASGVYFYKLQAGAYSSVKKLIKLK
jgi:hypothetical protein